MSFEEFQKYKQDGIKSGKMPWVYRYWDSVTDINQYKKAQVVMRRGVLIVSFMTFLFGFYLGLYIGGMI